MKSILFIYISAFIFNIINKFSYRSKKMIKSLSGLLQKIPFIKNKFAENPNSIIESNLEDFIIPGYMEHEAKVEGFIFYQYVRKG